MISWLQKGQEATELPWPSERIQQLLRHVDIDRFLCSKCSQHIAMTISSDNEKAVDATMLWVWNRKCFEPSVENVAQFVAHSRRGVWTKLPGVFSFRFTGKKIILLEFVENSALFDSGVSLFVAMDDGMCYIFENCGNNDWSCNLQLKFSDRRVKELQLQVLEYALSLCWADMQCSDGMEDGGDEPIALTCDCIVWCAKLVSCAYYENTREVRNSLQLKDILLVAKIQQPIEKENFQLNVSLEWDKSSECAFWITQQKCDRNFCVVSVKVSYYSLFSGQLCSVEFQHQSSSSDEFRVLSRSSSSASRLFVVLESTLFCIHQQHDRLALVGSLPIVSSAPLLSTPSSDSISPGHTICDFVLASESLLVVSFSDGRIALMHINASDGDLLLPFAVSLDYCPGLAICPFDKTNADCLLKIHQLSHQLTCLHSVRVVLTQKANNVAEHPADSRAGYEAVNGIAVCHPLRFWKCISDADRQLFLGVYSDHEVFTLCLSPSKVNTSTNSNSSSFQPMLQSKIALSNASIASTEAMRVVEDNIDALKQLYQQRERQVKAEDIPSLHALQQSISASLSYALQFPVQCLPRQFSRTSCLSCIRRACETEYSFGDDNCDKCVHNVVALSLLLHESKLLDTLDVCSFITQLEESINNLRHRSGLIEDFELLNTQRILISLFIKQPQSVFEFCLSIQCKCNTILSFSLNKQSRQCIQFIKNAWIYLLSYHSPSYCVFSKEQQDGILLLMFATNDLEAAARHLNLWKRLQDLVYLSCSCALSHAFLHYSEPLAVYVHEHSGVAESGVSFTIDGSAEECDITGEGSDFDGFYDCDDEEFLRNESFRTKVTKQLVAATVELAAASNRKASSSSSSARPKSAQALLVTSNAVHRKDLKQLRKMQCEVIYQIALSSCFRLLRQSLSARAVGLSLLKQLMQFCPHHYTLNEIRELYRNCS